MEKRKLIWYWIITILLSFCIFSGGLAQAFQVKGVVQGFKPLGYPTYFISIIGIWKVLGIIAILIPKFKLLKEWAYAGLIFNYTGAAISHLVMGDGSGSLIAPIIFIALVVCSWALRPSSRRL